MIDNGLYKKSVSFNVVLYECSGGATFCDQTDGGEEQCVTRVHIRQSEEARSKIDNLFQLLRVKADTVHLGGVTWQEQFLSALYVNGSPEDQQEASKFDWAMHFVSLPWKLLFALTPPTTFANGWIAFFVSLLFIGLVTAVVSDSAAMFGCVLAVPDEITAITFVALGTSLPDTFASKTAAVQEPFADASIGNVTGSNSVNVFLGLGLAWMVGAGYWAREGPTDEWRSRYAETTLLDTPDLLVSLYPEGAFIVKAGALVFSVVLYTCLATVVFILRRRYVGGELGGGGAIKWMSSAFFAALWLAYIVGNIIYFQVNSDS
jgi:solute carrier family 8 (sodium/calcium exchanger)